MGVTTKENGVSLGGDDSVLELVVIVTQPCEYTENH